MDSSDLSDISQQEAPHKEQDSTPLQDWGKKRLKVYAQVTSLSLAFALVFGALGYALGQKLGEPLLYTMLAVLVSYPLAQYFIYKMVTSTKS